MEEKDQMEEMISFKVKDFMQILEDAYTLGFKQLQYPMKAGMERVLEIEPDLKVLAKFLTMIDMDDDMNIKRD